MIAMNFGRIATSGVLALFCFLMLTDTAYAYLDPGTGSILLQGLIGAVAAGLAFFKFYWHRLKSVLRPKTQAESLESTPSDSESAS